MSKSTNKHDQFLTCGAITISMSDEWGAPTSVDNLFAGTKKFFARLNAPRSGHGPYSNTVIGGKTAQPAMR